MEIIFIFSQVLQIIILIDIVSSWIFPGSPIVNNYIKPVTEPLYEIVWIVVPEVIGFFRIRPLATILLLQLIESLLRSLI